VINVLSPEYWAERAWMPSVENVVLQLAWPALRVAGLPPEQVRLLLPSLKVTVPVAPAVTVAVRVSLLFGAVVYTFEGFGLRVVVLGRVGAAMAVDTARTAATIPKQENFPNRHPSECLFATAL